MEAADNCVKLHVGKQTHRLRDTLAVVAAKLPPGRFLRISRSTLVNIEQIQGLQRMFFNEYEVLLRNGTRLTSRAPIARTCGKSACLCPPRYRR